MKSSILLVVLAFCLCLSKATEDTESDQNADETISEKDGILQLENRNFHMALRKYEQLLVLFCKLPTDTHTA